MGQSGAHGRVTRASFWNEVGLLGRLAKAVSRSEYELETPKLVALVGALAYVVSPIDAIPDVVPLLGFADDAGVVAATLSLLSFELLQFRAWEQESENQAA